MNSKRVSLWKRTACFALLVLALAALAGCTAEPANQTGATASQAPSTQSYIFEAEYVDLTDKAGAGPSNAALETELVLADAQASNEHYIGYTYFTGLFFDFVITSDAAQEATVAITLGSDLGATKINAEAFEIAVNGTPIAFAEFRLPDSSGKVNKVFKAYDLGTAQLAQGENTITLKILQNELYNGGTGGPLIDCITLHTAATLTWEPHEDNIQ